MLRASNRPVLAYFDAIKGLRLRQVALILKAGYDPNLLVNARGQNGLQFMIGYFGSTEAHFRLQAPLSKAAYVGIAKLLLDSGLDPNAADLLSGETAIFDAIRLNDKDIVALLLNYVDFSIRNKSGETALMCAARFGSKQVMRMLLEHLRHLEMDGYFLRQRNRFGLTTLELARSENLECAKVLTKHLIAYGHQTGAVLARSSSHHQLLPRSLRGQMGSFYANPRAPAAAAAAAATAAALLVDDSASDYDSDVLGAFQPALVRSGARPLAASYKAATAAYYDPKAAEFNRYLLEQQELGGSDQPTMGGSAGGTFSDDEDFFAGPSHAGGTGALIRSRSCMLGPVSVAGGQAGGSKQSNKYASGTAQKKAAAEAAKWDASAPAGRSTIG